MLIFIIVKNLRKLNSNFVDVIFSPTLTMFCFLTIPKMNIKLSNDSKFIKKKFLHSFYDKNSLLNIFEETKLNSVQICLMFYCFVS